MDQALTPDPELLATLAKMDATLQQIVTSQTDDLHRVIIQAESPSSAAEAAVSGTGVEILYIDETTATMVERTNRDGLLWMASHANTKRLSTDAVIAAQQSTFTDGVTLRNTLGLLPGGGVVSGGSSFAGDKVVVAVIDSGIQPSKDLESNRILGFYDFTVNGTAEVLRAHSTAKPKQIPAGRPQIAY